MSSPAVRAQLTLAEGSRLGELEDVIQRGVETFLEVGTALCEIRDQRLYRESHATFDDYCRERWSFTPQHGGRLITAAKVARAIEPMGSIPNERQARELAPVLRDKGEGAVAQTWRRITDEHGADVTAKAISEHVHKNSQPTPERQEQLERAARGKLWAKLIRLEEQLDDLPSVSRALAAASSDDVDGWVRIAGEAIATLSDLRRRLGAGKQ